jgi:hypothetical protein
MVIALMAVLLLVKVNGLLIMPWLWVLAPAGLLVKGLGGLALFLAIIILGML